CYANTMNGGALVVGVRDDVAGHAAFVGSYLDTTWLRNRVWELTSPHHVVEIYEIDDERSNHARIYVIDVQPGVELVRVRNKLVGRIDKKCQPIEPTAAVDLLRFRKSFDWS